MQALASTAREILERQCRSRSVPTIHDDIAQEASRPTKELRLLADQYAKAFRHGRPEQATLNSQLAIAFSDQASDFVLFIAWVDYRRRTGKMPAPAQAVHDWVQALYPEQMLRPRNYSAIAPLSNITQVTRREQKDRLTRLVEFVQTVDGLSEVERTEIKPLVSAS